MKTFFKSKVTKYSTAIFLTLVMIVIISQLKVSKKLGDLTSKCIHLEAEIKANKTRFEEVNRDLEKEIHKVQGLKEKLDASEKKVQLVSDILNMVNKLKLNVQIISDPNDWQMESNTLSATYMVHNLGKLSCFVEMLKMIITRENDTEGKESLVEGVDYILQKRDFPILQINSNEKIQYKEMIIFNGKRLSKTFNNDNNKIVIKALFQARNNPAINSPMPFSLRKLMREEGVLDLFELTVIKEHSILQSHLRQGR